MLFRLDNGTRNLHSWQGHPCCDSFGEQALCASSPATPPPAGAMLRMSSLNQPSVTPLGRLCGFFPPACQFGYELGKLWLRASCFLVWEEGCFSLFTDTSPWSSCFLRPLNVSCHLIPLSATARGCQFIGNLLALSPEWPPTTTLCSTLPMGNFSKALWVLF